MWTRKQKCGLNAYSFPASYDLYNVTVGVKVAASTDPVVVNVTNTFNAAFAKANELIASLNSHGSSDISLRAALNMSGWYPVTPLERFVDWYNLENFYLLKPELVSAFGVFHDRTLADFGPSNFVVNDTRGTECLIDCFGKGFLTPPYLHLNTYVNSIGYSTECVCANVIENGITPNRYCGNYAIVTFSVGVFQTGNVSYTPPLPQWKIDAYNSFWYYSGFTVYIQFDKQFWDSSVNFAYPIENWEDLTIGTLYGRYI